MVLEVPANFDKLPWEFITTCDWCGKEFVTTKQRYKNNKHSCCSRKCDAEIKKSLIKPNCSCVVCGKPLHRKLSHINRTKNITCSHDCCYKLKKITMNGEQNHQYGLKGELNPTFKNKDRITVYGYKDVLNWDHPYHNSVGRVFEHRLVAEKYLLDNINSIEINHQQYLCPEFAVHHIDFDRLNNDVNNLCVLRKETHTSFHNLLITILRNDKGQITALQKPQDFLSKEELRDRFLTYLSTHNVYYHMINDSNIIA